MNEINTDKKSVGRPKGRKINWGEFETNLPLWKTRSNREIAEATGTSPINVFLKRQRLSKNNDVVFIGNPETGTKPKTRKVKEN